MITERFLHYGYAPAWWAPLIFLSVSVGWILTKLKRGPMINCFRSPSTVGDVAWIIGSDANKMIPIVCKKTVIKSIFWMLNWSYWYPIYNTLCFIVETTDKLKWTLLSYLVSVKAKNKYVNKYDCLLFFLHQYVLITWWGTYNCYYILL